MSRASETMRRGGLALLLLLAVAAAQAGGGDIDSALQGFDDAAPAKTGDIDSALQGFDNAAPEATQEQAPKKTARALSGALTWSAVWNVAHRAPALNGRDYRGLSRLRGKLNLEFDSDIGSDWQLHLAGHGWYDAAWRSNGRSGYSAAELDAHEQEARLGEAWLRGRLGRHSDIKLGRQIVVWGKSDSIRVTDIINPLDNRSPGLVDIEDLRLPLGMLRLDHYLGAWGLSALLIPHIRFNDNPPRDSEYDPNIRPLPPEQIPGGKEYAFAANGIFSGWDLSLYHARHYDDMPQPVMVGGAMQLQHPRLRMNGLAANIALGDWLLKGEVAQFAGYNHAAAPGRASRRLDTLVGFEYNGLRDAMLTLEIARRRVSDYHSALAAQGLRQQEWQSALRYQEDFMHARLRLILLINGFGEKPGQLNGGGFSRLTLDYDLADAVRLSGGFIAYRRGYKIPFTAIGDNDRVFVELKYSF